jgi:hypothetical protein
MKLKDAMANLKNLTDHELLSLRKQTSAMPWSLKKAGALTLIQAEIERRLATRNPADYSMNMVGTLAFVAAGAIVGIESADIIAKNF